MATNPRKPRNDSSPPPELARLISVACPASQQLAEQLHECLTRLEHIETLLSSSQANPAESEREYYSVEEFAELVERSKYTVREWCRLIRINAEKCDTGHGPTKDWKIHRDELARYRDHGLLPIPTKY